MTGPSAKKEMAERKSLAGSTTTTTKAAEPQSYFSRARAGLDDDSPGGRYRPDQIISGSSPTVEYPAGPAWTRDQVGIEPPLGVAIDDLEPTGNAHEIEHSLAQVAAPVVPGWPQRRDENGVAANPSVEERLATILPKIAVPIPAPPKRRKV